MGKLFRQVLNVILKATERGLNARWQNKKGGEITSIITGSVATDLYICDVLHKKSFLIVSSFLLVCMLSSCMGKWNEQEETSWRVACRENASQWAGGDKGADAYCDYAMQYLQTKYPDPGERFKHLDLIVNDSLATRWMASRKSLP